MLLRVVSMIFLVNIRPIWKLPRAQWRCLLVADQAETGRGDEGRREQASLIVKLFVGSGIIFVLEVLLLVQY
jgi:hypothetical protein